VQLLVRDPVSAERARGDGLLGVTEVADAVFSARTMSSGAVDEYLGAAPAPYVVVNASGLVARSLDQVAEYAGIVRALLDDGLTVVLVAHVMRSSASDLIACRKLHERVDDPRVVLIDRMLSPAEVRGLCAGARLVLAGRMHLAIQALWSAVPAITLSTQGKVEGLMQLFGTEALCVEPSAGLRDRVQPLITDVLARREWYSARIADRLPAVRQLSELNFEGLAETTPSPALEQETT
jgi:polysaccharide pyruvyl transferase WcaK-like protein